MIVQKTQNIPAEKLTKSRLLQRKLYCAAKTKLDRRFGILFDKVIRADILETAWKMVRANRGSAGADRQSIEDIERIGVAKFLEEIRNELIGGIYKPQPVLRKFIPKAHGKLRPLGIPTIKDRVVQMAVKIVIEPIFEAGFQDFSYGFRPKRSAHQAIAEVRKYINFGCENVIEVDLKNFFDSIPHDKLMGLVEKRISDPKILKLINAWLKVGVVSENGVTRSIIGTPQGGVISPLLANIFLNVLDCEWRRCRYDHKSRDAHLIRYADDMVILCKWRPEYYFKRLQEILASLGVEMNMEKTKVVNAKDGFDFLGVHFRTNVSRNTGRKNCYYWPSSKAVANFKQVLRLMINQRKTVNIPHIIEAVNPTIRGWGQYFIVTNASEILWELDRFICTRFNQLVKKSKKIRGVQNNVVTAKELYEQYGLVDLYGMRRRERSKLNATQ